MKPRPRYIREGRVPRWKRKREDMSIARAFEVPVAAVRKDRRHYRDSMRLRRPMNADLAKAYNAVLDRALFYGERFMQHIRCADVGDFVPHQECELIAIDEIAPFTKEQFDYLLNRKKQ